ncbi:TPA: hypothetical protein N0F65_012238 [Lagenidium giganteum]|uniref:Folate receptor-like domain-containing protein n=1 Tax=Lagenidium giganteum TaxID=4803 RepID=A0AAV2ZN72_9STRA|nr:TPA: hypothetical protein N0F65_012238 [Lagenidium giganteum]
MEGARVRWLLVLLALQLVLCNVAHAEPKRRDEDTCRSIGGLKFDSSQRPRQRSKGLEVCSKYRKNTCCNETHAYPLRLKIMEPVVAGFNRECQRFTEEMACSACHPFMATSKLRHVCPRLCSEWYSACKNEFYAYAGDGSLAPCYGNALICSELSSIASSGAEFCNKMGFQVGTEDDSEGDECFDGSVPTQLGEAEPTEPWQDMLKRLFDEQSEDPSGLFLVAVVVPFLALYLGNRLLRQWRHSNNPQLSIEEVRRMQQEAYLARGEAIPDDVDSDFSSDEDLPTEAPAAPPTDASPAE